MRIVLDASVALAAVLPDERSPYARAAMDVAIRGQLIVPSLWTYEVQNGLLMAMRRDRIDSPIVRDALAALDAVAADVRTPRRLGRDLELAQAYGLTVYDASYIGVALDSGTQLASVDKTLLRAARAARVSIFDGP